MAGDQTPPAGEYASTLDVFDSGALDGAGFVSVGVAGHPEGNPNIPPDVAWDALARKQAWGARTGVAVHVATQFGFDAGGARRFRCRSLGARHRAAGARGRRRPGFAQVAREIRGHVRHRRLARRDPVEPARARQPKSLVKTVDEVFPAIVRQADAAPGRRFVQPHFFAFGGVMKTVEWLEAVRAGRFDLADGAIAIRN